MLNCCKNFHLLILSQRYKQTKFSTATSYFIEPLSGESHIRKVLIKRFLSFIEHIKKSPKKLPEKLFELIKNDVSSVTGSNLRNIMILINKKTIEKLNPTDAENIIYCSVDDENKWKIEMTKELLEVRAGDLVIEGFSLK